MIGPPGLDWVFRPISLGPVEVPNRNADAASWMAWSRPRSLRAISAPIA